MSLLPDEPTVRVRFAPSPTGSLHIGGARTALFNWLFARRHGGVFLLRIEDTDRERSRQEYVEEIFKSLEWLGICRDESPVFQSRRLDLYRSAAEALLASNRAYRCFCTPADLETRRERAQADGEAFRYDGACGRLTGGEVAERLERGLPWALRIRVPTGTSAWDDLVRGPVSFENSTLDDFVIQKSDGYPTYHFAVVIDDIDMGITHIIRGDDHISNTPKQLVLYDHLEARPPRFAHIPLIHGLEGGRLSKRHGATSVMDYQRMGFVSEALVNYLALLGWSPGNDREIMDLPELVSCFDLGRVVKTPAVFDREKLSWMNGVHLARMSVARRTNLLIPFLVQAGLLRTGEADDRREWLESLVAITGDRLKLLPDIASYARFLFLDEVTPDDGALGVISKAAPDRACFQLVHDRLAPLEPFRRQEIEAVVRGAAAEAGLSSKRVFQPIRAAISGTLQTPGLFESLELLGKERTLSRIRLHLLETGGPAASGATY